LSPKRVKMCCAAVHLKRMILVLRGDGHKNATAGHAKLLLKPIMPLRSRPSKTNDLGLQK
jgi:hypothetical protein